VTASFHKGIALIIYWETCREKRPWSAVEQNKAPETCDYFENVVDCARRSATEWFANCNVTATANKG